MSARVRLNVSQHEACVLGLMRYAEQRREPAQLVLIFDGRLWDVASRASIAQDARRATESDENARGGVRTPVLVGG